MSQERKKRTQTKPEISSNGQNWINVALKDKLSALRVAFLRPGECCSGCVFWTCWIYGWVDAECEAGVRQQNNLLLGHETFVKTLAWDTVKEDSKRSLEGWDWNLQIMSPNAQADETKLVRHKDVWGSMNRRRSHRNRFRGKHMEARTRWHHWKRRWTDGNMII